MKALLLILLAGCAANTLSAQVKIGGNVVAPHPSAILELDGGNNRGLLLPRIRKADMLAIASPAEGLTVYVTDEQATYLRRQGNWIKLSTATDVFELPYAGIFSLSAPVFSIVNNASGGTSIYGSGTVGTGVGVHGHSVGAATFGIKGTSVFGRGGYFNARNGYALVTDSGRIGLGNVTPNAFLDIDATLNNTDTTVIIDDNVDPVIQFKKNGVNKGYVKMEGNNLVLRPNGQNSSGKVIIQSYNDGPSMFVDAVGHTSFGAEVATYGGTNGYTVNIRGDGGKTLSLDASLGSGGPVLGFTDNSNNNNNQLALVTVNETKMMTEHKNRRYEWQGYAESAMKLYLNPDYPYKGVLSVTGRIGAGAGIGMPQAAIHAWSGDLGFGASEDITMIVQGIDPIVHFRNSSSVDKAFIQQVTDDIKIGTFANNDKGRVIIRTNGLDRMWVDSVGYVTIGGKIGPSTSGPYKLAVRGKIAATDFNVVSTASWPDYVFAPGYQLLSLEETEAYIKSNNHLPNMPAAAAVEANGYSVDAMQKKMLEKIEELTLHLIDAKKEINALKARINNK